MCRSNTDITARKKIQSIEHTVNKVTRERPLDDLQSFTCLETSSMIKRCRPLGNVALFAAAAADADAATDAAAAALPTTKTLKGTAPSARRWSGRQTS